MRDVSILSVKSVIKSLDTETLVNKKWVPARPLGFSSFRYKMRALWLVFRGKADVIVWPEDQ